MHFEREDLKRITDALGLKPVSGSWSEDAELLGEDGYAPSLDRESTARMLEKYPPETCPLCGGCCDAVPEDEDLFFICKDCRTEFTSQMVELVGRHIVRRVRR